MDSLTILPILLVLSIALTMAAMIFLMLNARDLARLFSGPRNDLAPGPQTKPRTTQKTMWLAFLLFNLGWIAAVAIWFVGIAKSNEGPAEIYNNREIVPQSVPTS